MTFPEPWEPRGILYACFVCLFVLIKLCFLLPIDSPGNHLNDLNAVPPFEAEPPCSAASLGALFPAFGADLFFPFCTHKIAFI